MGRYGRINQPDLTYHVINRGNNRNIIFKKAEDYQHYLNTIQRYKKKYQFKLFAFCLMPNHVHLLIKVSEQGSISKIMQSITVAHTRYYNEKYRRCGHVWQGRFNSPVVSEDDHFFNVMRYIEQNPVRAKMVARISDYPWSSYRLNISKKESLIIERNENLVYKQLGPDLISRIQTYRKLVAEDIEQNEIERIWKSTRQGINYISERFAEQIPMLLPQRRKRGRPKSFN